jgi:uncharacterized protein (DUF302 family)
MLSIFKTRPLITLLTGIGLGILISIFAMFVLMPSMMLSLHTSKYETVTETGVRLKEAIEQQGWVCPAIRDMTKTMDKHGIKTDKEFIIVELCKAAYAFDVLNTNPEVLTLMPCSFGVYKDESGAIKITGMNTRLMGTMFGGNVARVMGKSVAADEDAILAKVIKNQHP